LRRPSAVPWYTPERSLERREQGMEPTPPTVKRRHVAGRDPYQADQLVAVPDAIPVGLAESDASAEHGAIETQRVDLDGRGEIRIGISEVQATAAWLDQAQPAVPQVGEHPESKCSGGSLGRGHRRQATPEQAGSHGGAVNPPTLRA
jgi:hypothetical protein